ncbi:flagellar hook-associated protein FlgK [Rhizobium straminoryzae]|uniref:Flagellar hook-associated protein 1 n=1 Tax=Rhizobium straminoryzae TaxID=1387186 RepID=A0A549TIE9_9HYPH|nr:flagellar hook-associated protein FlgK [Rhizobium straminoryzae]TRL43019.1 flagellar hook-associated protein FlgK [Rhizobium straminoryzae]
MSLSTALSTAQSIFNNTGSQTAVTSTNISNVQNPDYIRRTAVLVTAGNGALVASTERAQNATLFRQTITSTSQASGQETLLSGLKELRSLLGNNDYDSSPSARLSKLVSNLDAYAAKPNEGTLASTVVSSAQDVADTLNNASAEVQGVRARADAQIKTQVDKLNTLLSKFESANNEVMRATISGSDGNNALDTRDGLLKQISDIVGISTVTRANNDVAIYTSDGTTLFETIPRTVSFSATATYTATVTGNSIYVDGVAMQAGTGADTDAQGSLQALLQIRDDVAPKFQAQLDEIARGVIVSFAETGPGGTLPAKAGLFTNGVDDSVATSATIVPGLAASISVNAAAKAKPQTVRDGGMNGAAYLVNTTAATGFSTLLDGYSQALQTKQSFDPATGIEGSFDVISFASDSAGWLENLRSTATAADETKSAAKSRAVEAHSSESGVSLDEELSLLLDIEQSYKAATKLVSTIDEMMKALLDMAR